MAVNSLVIEIVKGNAQLCVVAYIDIHGHLYKNKCVYTRVLTSVSVFNTKIPPPLIPGYLPTPHPLWSRRKKLGILIIEFHFTHREENSFWCFTGFKTQKDITISFYPERGGNAENKCNLHCLACIKKTPSLYFKWLFSLLAYKIP